MGVNVALGMLVMLFAGKTMIFAMNYLTIFFEIKPELLALAIKEAVKRKAREHVSLMSQQKQRCIGRLHVRKDLQSTQLLLIPAKLSSRKRKAHDAPFILQELYFRYSRIVS